MAKICKAILLASAIPTNILGLRARSRPIQPSAAIRLRAPPMVLVIAPMISRRRISLWPAFDIRTNRALPPEEFWRGTSPNHATSFGRF